ncbi:2-deoxyribose-5-phosphate aldolase, partial [candidate division KSB1 bacterium]|nr:2-deoxyribose-5-phosphate aldolase [candidate division KSB1 bacterium]
RIKQVIPESVKVKAAGGVKTLKQVIELMEEGVDRIGTSSAGQIMSELEK